MPVNIFCLSCEEKAEKIFFFSASVRFIFYDFFHIV